MTIREFTDSIIRNIKKEKQEKNSKAFRTRNMYAVAGIFSAIFGIVAITTALPMGLAGIGTALAALSGYKATEKKQKMEQNLYDKEIQHLENLKKSGIRVDRESTNARNNKYSRALANIRGKKEHINTSNKRDNIVCGVSAASCVLGILAGGLLGYTSPVIAGYKFITDRTSKKDYADYINDKLELDNVSNELKIIRHASTHRTPTRTTSSTVLHPVRGLNNTKSKTYTKEQMDAADKYINALSNLNTSKEDSKKIVKK